jgi:hypothetical protein
MQPDLVLRQLSVSRLPTLVVDTPIADHMVRPHGICGFQDLDHIEAVLAACSLKEHDQLHDLLLGDGLDDWLAGRAAMAG